MPTTAKQSTAEQITALLLTPQMMGFIASMLLDAIQAAAGSGAVDKIIAQIKAFLPALIQLAPEFVSKVSDAIGFLQQNGDLTAAQIAELSSAKAILDTETDAAIAAAIAYANS